MQATQKRIKVNLYRITPLLFALLLTATTLSPTITAYADGSTTHESESGAEHGGASGSFGDDDEEDYSPKIDSNTDGSRTLILNQNVTLMYGDSSNSNIVKTNITGNGRYVERTYYWNYAVANDHLEYGTRSYIFSDKSFDAIFYQNGDRHTGQSNYYNGIYYYAVYTQSGTGMLKYNGHDYQIFRRGFANMKHITSNTPPTAEELIDSGDLNLSRDDYKDLDLTNITPVRDESIGYLPRARYFDDRKSNANLNTVTSTIQWDSFVEPYASDIDNYYYVEVYANLHYKLGNTSNPFSSHMYQYKKYGELKYVNERLQFSYYDPVDTYLFSIGAHFDLPSEGINYNQDLYVVNRYVSEYYVRLLHYDYDKEQLLCGGWTKLTPNENGGCTSETGDFPDGDPDDGDGFVPDDDDPKDWDDTGWEPDPKPDDPDDDDDDFDIDTSNIGAFILSAVTSLLNAFKKLISLVGEFPDLCKHVFSFLPDEIYTLMFGGTAAIIVMRFLGR